MKEMNQNQRKKLNGIEQAGILNKLLNHVLRKLPQNKLNVINKNIQNRINTKKKAKEEGNKATKANEEALKKPRIFTQGEREKWDPGS